MSALFTSITVVLLLIGLGRLIDRGAADSAGPELAAPVYHLVGGWAAVSLVGVLCALAGFNLRWPLMVLAGLGAIGFGRSSSLRAAWPLIFSWLLLLPLLVVASSIPPTMFDEFAQWLPNARFLIDHGQFPGALHPNVWSAKPAYPPAFPLIGYAINLFVPRGFEFGPKIFAVLLGGGFGLLLAQRFARTLGLVAAIGIGTAFAVVLNPFFDPRTALTAYADMPSAYVLALYIYAAWRAAEEQSRLWLTRVAACTVVLVLLRDTNAIFIAAGAGALLLLGRRALAPLAVTVAAGASAFLLWRGYIAVAAMPPAMSARPFAAWDWSAPVALLRSFLFERLAGNLLIGIATCILLAVIIAVGFIAVRRAAAAERRLIVLTSAVAIGWLVFLIGAYIAVFTPEEAARAAGFWRYLSELGPTVILVLFQLLPIGPFENIAARLSSRAMLKGAGVALVCLVSPFVVLLTKPYWQIDCRYPQIADAHALARVMKAMNLGNEPITVVRPHDALGYALVIDYDLHRPIGSSLPAHDERAARREGLLLETTKSDAAAYSLKRWTDGSWNEVARLAPERSFCRSWWQMLWDR